MLVYKSKWVTDNLSSPEYNISRHSNPISMHKKTVQIWMFFANIDLKT